MPGGRRSAEHRDVKRTRLPAVTVLLAVLLLAPAASSSDDEVKRRGQCDLGSEWRLIVRRESASKLRVRYVLDTDRPGQTWAVFLSMNGSWLFKGQRTTNSRGYIRVTRFPTDRSGDDTIKGSANNLVNGEYCTGSLVYPF